MIESVTNRQMKKMQKLMKQSRTRRQERCFVVEGWKMVAEALAYDLVLHLYVKESEADTFKQHLKELGSDVVPSDVPVDIVRDSVFLQMSNTVTPQGIMAVAKIPFYDWQDIVSGQAGGIYKETKLLILEDIQDPGNLGTIFRTAEGAGMSGVILSKGCVDLFNPKVVRSTMGSLFRVPFFVCEDIALQMKGLQEQGFSFYAAHLQGEEDFTRVSYRGKLGILIGNEANGLSGEMSELADVKVKIPMEGELESLNAAVSASLFAYEVHRQLRSF